MSGIVDQRLAGYCLSYLSEFSILIIIIFILRVEQNLVWL